MHGIEPWSYLRDLFCLLPSWPKARVLDLAPANWQQTLEQADTQQRLAANPFRAVLLGAGGHAPIYVFVNRDPARSGSSNGYL